ncbi:MAG: hypothetical protein JSS27_00810 [Planctomycetes bacterium]|nr:hypothetical protein [Planctomycetota bacterium]
MTWLTNTLDELAHVEEFSYTPGGVASAEPAAWAALALAAHDRTDAALRAARQLARLQNVDGSVGISADQNNPYWPTPMAMCAWHALKRHAAEEFQPLIDRAQAWLLVAHGKSLDQAEFLGHNTRLIGWAWVEGTHSWVEPTAFAVLALKAAGLHDHARTREAVELLVDRLLPEGGTNYGNTFVLGQELRPHVEPTGLVLLALRNEADASGRLTRTVDYEVQTISSHTTAASLSYALLGLAAWQRTPAEADAWLAAAAERTRRRPGALPRLAMLAQAARGAAAPLVQIAQEGAG